MKGLLALASALAMGLHGAQAASLNFMGLREQIPFLREDTPPLSDGFDKLIELAGGARDSLDNNLDTLLVWKELLKEFTVEELMQKVEEYKVNNPNFSPRAKVQETLFKSTEEDTVRYETVKHEDFPDYKIRVSKLKPETLGIDSVNQYTGYLDFQDKHFFYYFFESRNDPENDPVILWLNGGPGCSSMTGLFFELGPSFLGPELKPVYNPYSWNSNASVIFLEQPVGVGYSYGDEKVSTTYAAAKDVYVFLELFYQKFPQFAKNAFHISGESYAGHYIPAIASEIINHADKSFELTSVLIGNGITDSLIQDKYYQPMACGLGGYKAVLDNEECDAMTNAYPRCAKLVQSCYNYQSAFTCVPANVYCAKKFLEPYEKTGLNYYDIRGPCEDSDGGLCYKGLDYVEQYLNLPYVQEALGSEVTHYEGCANDIGVSFALTGDESKPFQGYIAELLNKGYPVLIYAGDKDFICNWLGNYAWTNDLDWILGDGFREEVLKPWEGGASGETSGEVKSFGGLTFLRVYDAGHMVPHDQPAVALNMVNTWINGDYSYGYGYKA
jgi:cathepsin A (carboxypeptidase C)